MFSANDAFAFTSPHALDALLDTLGKTSTWEWLRRDGERHGEYLSAMVHPDWGMVRVYVEPDHYVFDVEYRARRPEARAEYDALLRKVETEILPALGGANVRRIEGYGR